jgi:hypothetical protein
MGINKTKDRQTKTYKAEKCEVLVFLLSLPGTKDGTQGLAQGRQALSHLRSPPAPKR